MFRDLILGFGKFQEHLKKEREHEGIGRVLNGQSFRAVVPLWGVSFKERTDQT
jgi:hypothetical protein